MTDIKILNFLDCVMLSSKKGRKNGHYKQTGSDAQEQL